VKLPWKKLGRYAPLGLGLGLLAILALLVPWREVLPYLARLGAPTYVVLVIGSLVYYTGRAVRYWLMLRMLGERPSFTSVAIACLAAQPVAVLPGGELYRTTMLKRYSGVSLKQSVPSVVAQSLAEEFGLLAIALAGAVLMGHYGWVIVGVGVVVTAIWAFIYWNNSQLSHQLVNKLPWVNLGHRQVRSFLDKNRQLLSGTNFLILVAAAGISTLAGVAIVYAAAQGVGEPLGPLQAATAYAVPMILEAVSFLPGGFGVSEQGSVGVLALFGVPLPAAVAVTIIMRIFTLGMGFVYGFGAMAAARWWRWDDGRSS
jgi:uncharacterized protein (TIRG00374 family)